MNSAIPSKTYKLRLPDDISPHAIYFTIVGHSDPMWMFVNSKSMDSFQWVTALMTSYSRQIKADVPIREIINQMKETFSPNGRYVIPDGSGREVPSLIHHLGLVLEEHCATL
jgi:hypothetical protein|tara:strand:+ start:1945 stop:2280 length:336 start_codon:yes stop_codon:yes gene_type:complete